MFYTTIAFGIFCGFGKPAQDDKNKKENINWPKLHETKWCILSKLHFARLATQMPAAAIYMVL